MVFLDVTKYFAQSWYEKYHFLKRDFPIDTLITYYAGRQRPEGGFFRISNEPAPAMSHAKSLSENVQIKFWRINKQKSLEKLTYLSQMIAPESLGQKVHPCVLLIYRLQHFNDCIQERFVLNSKFHPFFLPLKVIREEHLRFWSVFGRDAPLGERQIDQIQADFSENSYFFNFGIKISINK